MKRKMEKTQQISSTMADDLAGFGCCAVIGNSGDLLKIRFGKEVDSYDDVIRENEAPIQSISFSASFIHSFIQSSSSIVHSSPPSSRPVPVRVLKFTIAPGSLIEKDVMEIVVVDIVKGPTFKNLLNLDLRHTEWNIAETGLNLLLEMLKNFQASEFFACSSAPALVLLEPLWDASTISYPYPNNAMFVREYTIKLLGTSFPNMTASEVTQFVNGLFESRNYLSTFKNHIRDFLVQSKEFSAQDNKDLYAEEAAAQRERERQRMRSIPGLFAPNEIQDEMVDS
ncbi:hypothetical protein Pint_21760 [Pistacia integerrima]|uniref:Uncharacterized protein n=1 Tax=Pistacia integerrima TaxID=434235 RepID=A0ACC0XF57_9ROSI|nr:hypothetical protein Pint_21760 [Pistacia integerrima]